jgi:protein associated with RNAse G/E
MMARGVTINSRKFDGSVHRTWQAELVSESDTLLTFVGEFEEEIRHPHLGIIRRGTISHEYYWLDRWYSVFRFHEPGGERRNFYCNVNMPPMFENGVLDYVDLDIDVLVWPDFTYEILDRDDFARNAIKYFYSKELIAQAEASLEQLIALIEGREFPFSEAR